MSFHILKGRHKNLYSERNFLWRRSGQMLNSSNLFKYDYILIFFSHFEFTIPHFIQNDSKTSIIIV
jgi:hypothetical protein